MSWAADRRIERIATAVVTTVAPLVGVGAVGVLMFQETSRRTQRVVTESKQPVRDVSALGPITITHLDCSGRNYVASSDPEGAILRQQPDQFANSAGHLNAGTDIPIEKVVKKHHIEGPSQYWLLLDASKVPNGNISPYTNEAFIRLGIFSSDTGAGVNTNADLTTCPPTEKP